MAKEKIKKKKTPEQNKQKTKNISSNAPLFAIMNHISDLFFLKLLSEIPPLTPRISEFGTM